MNVTDEQVALFDRDGVITLDTPVPKPLLAEASKLMDELFPLSFDKRNHPGEKPTRYRVGRNEPTEDVFVQILQNPFFEHLAGRMLHAESVHLVSIALRTTHPEPGAEFQFNEHTDMSLGLQDFSVTPRRMAVSMFLWIDDVDEKIAPLMVRPGSHRRIAEAMGDNPRYIHRPWDPDDFINVPNETSLPLYIATGPKDWPKADFSDPIPCVARAGQVTVLNPAVIHAASTNVGQGNRKSMHIDMWPAGVEIGETKNRRINREKYVEQLRTILPPERQSILPAGTNGT